jgi:protein SCO1
VTAALITLLAVAATPPQGVKSVDVPLEADVTIEERLNEPVPRDLAFVDSTGKAVTLGESFRGRPVVVAMVYYRCPVLCGLLLGGLTRALQALDWRLGSEYDLVTVSLDPSESPKLAAEKRHGHLQALGMPDGRWTFLTGKSESIDALAESLGYRYRYVAAERQFAHVAALAVLTPDARISRYLYGVEFPPKQVKLALFEASGGKVGTAFERTLLRCYKYDKGSKSYELFITRYFRAGGALLLGGMIWLLVSLWRRDLKRTRAA